MEAERLADDRAGAAVSETKYSDLCENAARYEPACTCCPHISLGVVDDDPLLAEMWEYCPTRGCMWQLCEHCTARRAESSGAKR